nr:reverse transcriptase domain-containing protein [Tanacetum cinerariifolium]
ELPDIDSFNDFHPHFDDDPLSGSTTYSANSLLEEFAAELALIIYPLDYDDNLTCDIDGYPHEVTQLPKKLGDPGKFLIPCGFNKLKFKALANLAGIARDVFILVGKFTFPAGFIIVNYESDPRVPLILGRPFLRTARALINVHGEEMILRDEVKADIFDPEGGNVLPEKLLDLDFTKDLHPPHHINQLSGSTTSFSPTYLLEEFADELALITFLPGNNDLYDLADLNNNLVDSMPEMFTDEHALDYSSPLLYDEYDDDLFEVKSDTKNIYDDPFDSKGEKIKESKLLVDELDLLFNFLLPSEYDSFNSEDFPKVEALPSTNNEDKVFNPDILIHENLFEIITRVAQDKMLAISHASLMQENFDPPLYELPFFK